MNLTKEKPTITMRHYGMTANGESVTLYTLVNTTGATMEVINYGGTITRLQVPDKDGNMGDVVLGFNSLAEYEKDSPYFGCIVGRYGNRIANGEFELNGVKYTLAQNNEPGGIGSSLHGGLKGFDKVVWDAKPLIENSVAGLKLTYLSPDGEENFPGNLNTEVTYWWTNENELKIEYFATTDKATPVNLTQHTYFNLKGEGNGDILDHELMLKADQFTPVNAGLIPTGELAPVTGTPFDFLKATKIGDRIDADYEQIKAGMGYDHNWVLNKNKVSAMELFATVYEATSGRFMEALTCEPAVQFYSGNFLDGTLKGKGGNMYEKRNGFCLETQHFPDSPNQPEFPSTILEPGEEYITTTVYRFSTK